MTFFATRVVVSEPGRIGAFTDGRLASTAFNGLASMAARLSAVSSKVRPGLPAAPRLIRPAPMSNGSAGVARSCLTTDVVAVVIRADLIWPGVQSGCRALSSTAEPAMCGDDIEVPAMAM